MKFQDQKNEAKLALIVPGKGWGTCWIRGPLKSSEMVLWLTSGHSRTFPGAGCCAHRVTLPPSGFGKMLPIFNSPTSQVNKLETDRMSIIRQKIKGRGMKRIPSRVSEENAVSLAASKTPGTVRPWVC